MYREFNLADAKNEDWSASNTEITEKTNTTIHGLESSREYEFVIEAVLSKVTKSLAPPPPKVIHNNERSMVREFTKPEFPKNLQVELSNESSIVAKVKWDAIITNIEYWLRFQR